MTAGETPALDNLERFWTEILSGEPDRIRRTADALGENERQAVLVHLRSMATRDDWTPLQRANAWAALVALGEA